MAGLEWFRIGMQILQAIPIAISIVERLAVQWKGSQAKQDAAVTIIKEMTGTIETMAPEIEQIVRSGIDVAVAIQNETSKLPRPPAVNVAPALGL
jgi:hypothetical protein